MWIFIFMYVQGKNQSEISTADLSPSAHESKQAESQTLFLADSLQSHRVALS